MDCLMERVREDAGYVISAASDVRLCREAVSETAKNIPRESLKNPSWDENLHFSGDAGKTAEWVFVVDSLNFSFWPDPGRQRWTVDYGGAARRGYFALSCALKRAAEEGTLILDPADYSRMTDSRLEKILAGAGDPPMLAERAAILRENGRILIEKFGGRFGSLVESCAGSASKLVRLLFDNFPTFRDKAEYRGREVFFLKRAQILAGDLSGAFRGTGLGSFRDLDRLTAFADYRIPQVLRSLGILEYSGRLAAIVDAGKLLPPGSAEEVEIRAGAVAGVEALAAELKKMGIAGAAPYALDWWLWNESHKPGHNLKPYHLTRTIFY